MPMLLFIMMMFMMMIMILMMMIILYSSFICRKTLKRISSVEMEFWARQSNKAADGWFYRRAEDITASQNEQFRCFEKRRDPGTTYHKHQTEDVNVSGNIMRNKKLDHIVIAFKKTLDRLLQQDILSEVFHHGIAIYDHTKLNDAFFWRVTCRHLHSQSST